MTKVPLWVNPKARAVRAFGGGVNGIAQVLGNCEVVTDRESWASSKGQNPVAVVGGDGTLREAVEALGPGARIIPVPLGHGNDLARRMGLTPGNLSEAKERLRNPQWKDVDLWVATDKQGHRIRFVNSFGIGLDGEVNKVRETVPKWLDYRLIFLMTLPSLPLLNLRVDGVGCKWEGETFWMGLFNSGLTGGGIQIAPQADPSDGNLDLAVFLPRSRMALPFLLPRAEKGKLTKKDVFRGVGNQFVVSGKEGIEVPLAVDGDLVMAPLPLQIEREGAVHIAV
ncbi:hypothetical protein H8D30_03255 [bacterium]|nr:hypothetical protein [bacterium]